MIHMTEKSTLLAAKVKIKRENMAALARYRDYLRLHPKLTYLFVELTNQCNLRCLHCGSDCSRDKRQYIATEMLLAALREIAKDFVPRTVMVCLTGGEPLLHPDFSKIVQEIVKLGFPWGMTTNGTLIDAAKAQELKAFGLGSITISLDGPEEMHERLRNVKGCFRKAVDAIERLHSVGMPIQVTSVIHKGNFPSLEAMYRLMCDMNIQSWRIINLEPIGRAKEHQHLLLSRGEMLQLLDFIREKRFSTDTPMDVLFGCSHYLSYEYEHEVRDNYFLCGAGIYVGSILCNGDIYSCLDIERRSELVQGNIATDRFSNVWRERFREFRMNRADCYGRCATCGENAFCNADSMHTWDFERNEPMFCILREGSLYDDYS